MFGSVAWILKSQRTNNYTSLVVNRLIGDKQGGMLFQRYSSIRTVFVSVPIFPCSFLVSVSKEYIFEEVKLYSGSKLMFWFILPPLLLVCRCIGPDVSWFMRSSSLFCFNSATNSFASTSRLRFLPPLQHHLTLSSKVFFHVPYLPYVCVSY